MDPNEDRELIARARHDPQLFGEIYEKYYSQIFSYALKRTGDVTVAEDITSETFFRALKKLGQFKGQNTSFSAWLYRIANNEINQYFRRGKSKPGSLDLLMSAGFDMPAPDDLVAEIEELESQLQRHKEFLAILQELKKLPTKYQEVITLRYFENKKLSEIGEILGKKEGTVKSLLSRGLDLLREKCCQSHRENETQPFCQLSILSYEGQENKCNPAKESDL